ncbi:conserved hypothetical protein [Talaromyces marneffei ATCC 18224]|uniref:Xylanolytic transcriptional activator regulatory domain-containing protein n=3 Tax=Talaromyces marneffei TaxID=37727 RepID=B6Q9W9_TALMQ|nr:conserved hypothetical protein [Talaromyces marneffei ATCC 18224]
MNEKWILQGELGTEPHAGAVSGGKSAAMESHLHAVNAKRQALAVSMTAHKKFIAHSLDEPPIEALVEASVQNNPQTQSTPRAIQDQIRLSDQDNRPREQSSLKNSAPVVEDETQQGHEIGLVSLFRGEDPRYIGPSSGYFFTKRIFSNTGWRGRHDSIEATTTGNVSHFPIELLNFPTPLPQQKEVALKLSVQYFWSIHLIYPFLHEQTHMQMIDEVYQLQEKDSDPISNFQIYMVMAIASLNLSRQCKQLLPMEGYYASAMKHVDHICYHGSMAALQCLLLLMVYALYNPSCKINIWNLNYQCLASVIDLGLQRDVRASPNYPMSLFKQEMRTRVFWVFPLDISDCDIINTVANQSTSDGNPSHMSLSIRLFRLAQLNSEIKYVMHSIRRDIPSYAYPPVKDILTWQRDMMRTLEGWYYDALQHTEDGDSGMKEYCIAKYHELMILLLRPSPAIPDPADEIFDICSDHAFALLQCFGDLYEKGNLLYSRFIVHSVFLGTLVMLHCIWKFPRTASKFSIDQLIIKFNIAQNILSSIGEHWAEALSARDCIARLSNVTIQRLLKNQPAGLSVT